MKRGYWYLSVTFFFWGSMYVVSKYALACIPPLTLSFLKQALSVTLIGLLAYRKGLKPIAKEHWGYFLIIGVLGYALNGIFQFQATHIMNASLSSLFNSMNPLFISLFAVALLKEKMTKNKTVGMMVSFAGVCMILGLDGTSIRASGVVFALLSVLVWSFSSVLMRKVSQYYGSEQIAFTGMLVGLPVCAVSSALELQTREMVVEWQAVLAVFYLAVFCSMLTNLLWNASLKILDASVCALFYPLQTFFSAILGIAFLHERISAPFVIGGILISAGVILGLWEKYYPKKNRNMTMVVQDKRNYNVL